MQPEIGKFSPARLVPGAVAITIAEDEAGLSETVSHNAKLGFLNLVVVSKNKPEMHGWDTQNTSVSWYEANSLTRQDQIEILNDLFKVLSGRWVYYSFNAEFLFFPFVEHRSVEDLARFMEEERRGHVFSYVVDLYTTGSKSDEVFARNGAYLDASGYYAMDRFEDGESLDRQIEVFGGLKWRYSEHVPWDRQRIDRVPFFKVAPGITLGPDFRLSEPEMNTYACPWHHNVTCAIASFRTSKSLRRNPGSAATIDSFMWAQSVPFEWSSKQLMDLGMMEPGQWF